MASEPTRCPDDLVVAELLEGTLDREARAGLLGHAADCEDCRVLLSELAAAGPTAEAARGEAATKRIDRYELLHTIGAGGMGVVYAAHDRELDRRVALKLLRDERDERDQRDERSDDVQRRSLLAEARAMAKLAHPNVVRVFDVGEHDGRVFVTMELVEGGTLRDFLAAGAHAFSAIARVFEGAGRGLAAAHAAGMVHRDFKPENVLLRDGNALVTDFGLARLMGDAGVVAAGEGGVAAASDGAWIATRRSAIAGTLHYMAPEQLRGERADARSDVFGYCVAYWEALHGEKPFEGQSPSELLAAMAHGPRAVGKRADLPGATLAALRRGLAFAPEERPGSMDALLALASPAAEQRGRGMAGVGVAVVAVAAVIGIAVVAWRGEASQTTLTSSSASGPGGARAAGATATVATDATATTTTGPAAAGGDATGHAVGATATATTMTAGTTTASTADADAGTTGAVVAAASGAVGRGPLGAARRVDVPAVIPAPSASVSARGAGGVFVRPPF